MRMIDADEFKKLLLKERDAIPKLIFDRYDFGVGRRNHEGDLIRAGIRTALRCMERTPTIKADPVRHGRWVIQRYYGGMRKGMVARVVCSECFDPNEETNYCPNCGAKMDGGAE